MADVKWIKVNPNIFADDKILIIEDMPEADALIVIWFKLLCLAGVKNNSGVFMLNDKIPYTEKMLASIFRRKETIVKLALSTFEELGMIEIINDAITIPNWNKYQNEDGLEKIQTATRERVAKFREKQKLLAQNGDVTLRNVTDNVTVTECNAIDKDKDKEKDKEEDKEKDKDKKKPAPQVFYPLDEKLDETFKQYIEHRKAMKKPLKTEYAIKLAMNNLAKLSNGDNDVAIEILNQSIVNGWQGLFELKGTPKKQQQTGSTFDFFANKAMEDMP